MSRIRTIKPEFWKHETLSELPPECHMLAAALLNYADDEGYFNANPKLVKAECLPLREDSLSVHECLSELSRVGFIALGTADDDGRRYGVIVNFSKHQRINRPSPSEISGKTITWDNDVSIHGAFSESSVNTHDGKGREQGTGKGTGNPPVVPPSGDEADEQTSDDEQLAPGRNGERFEDFWRCYPKRRNKKQALAQWKKKRLDERADTIIDDVCRRQIQDAQWLDGYIPEPQRFLRDERWTDDYQPMANARTSPAERPSPQRKAREYLEQQGLI